MKSTKSVRQQLKENVISIFALILIIAWASYVIYSDVTDMQQAATTYDYCKALCDLVELGGKSITWCVYWAVLYLTYVHKQYTRWILWLYYIAVVIFVIYYIVAGNTLNFVCDYMGAEYLDRLPSLSRRLYGAPVYFMFFSFMFIPKLIKDTIKLKQEQELTV